VSADRVVVWDLGNVVIPWDRRAALARFVDDPAEVERLADEVFDLETNLHLDRSTDADEVRAALEERHPGHGWVLDGYLENFRHSLGAVIAGTEALIDDLLAAGVRCVGLSNWSALSFDGVPDDYPVLGRLDGILISGEVGVTKPDAAIFRHCEERFGFTPAQALFFDDNAANVAGARAAGWDAELFRTPGAARDAVRARGLLPG
jgi:2-haloacid dehalogenase